MLHRFYGGVHPAGRKGQTKALTVTPLKTPPARVLLAVVEPLVQPGDHVNMGQRLCNGDGRHPAVHASVSGRVAAVEPCPCVVGGESLAVTIDNDGLDTPAPAGKRAPAESAPNTLDSAEIRAAVAWAGIGGLGGACFSSAAKLEAALGKVDTLIINACECESYLTADHRLLLERAEAVLTGARLLARALELPKVIIAAEGDKYDGISALRALLPLRGGDVEMKVLRTRYPQGAERQLIQKVTGRKVPPGAFPMAVGCAVFNVATAAAVFDAVYDGKPLTHRIVTVTGGAIAQPQNLLVPIGTPISDLIEEAGGFDQHPERVLAGGGMMGIAQRNLTAPITQGVGGIVAMGRKEVKPAAQAAGECLRCGRCAEVCPMGLTPVYLRLYAQARQWRELEQLHITDCIECGACAYACPARIRLVGDIQAGKEGLKAPAAQREEVGT